VITGKAADSHQVSVEKIGTGEPPANQPIPRSDTQVDPNAPQQQQQQQQQQQDGIQSLIPNAGNEQPAATTPGGGSGSTQSQPAAAQTGSTQAQATGTSQTAGDPAPTPPARVNDAKTDATDQASSSQQVDDKNQSSSKKKKKKGLGKLNPF
jgi:outer membrane protein assembly factor BamD